MTEKLSGWVLERYASLWKAKRESPFTSQEVMKILVKDKNSMRGRILSELRKRGWLIIEVDSNDARRHIYQLKSPELVILELAKSIERRNQKNEM